MAEVPEGRKKTDLRVVKTLDAIRTHFEQLVCECGYDKLTVARLCESARINKKTFYRYYKSLDDLLAQVQREFTGEYVELTGHLRIPEDAGEITRRFILYSCDAGARSPFYEAVTCSSAFSGMQDSMIDSVLESRRVSPGGFGALSAEEASIVISFLQQTGVGAYRQWVADGKQLPPERLARLTADLAEGALERVLRERHVQHR